MSKIKARQHPTSSPSNLPILLTVSFTALTSASCSGNIPSKKGDEHQPQVRVKAVEKPEDLAKVSLDRAKELCADNFNRIFTNLYIDSRTDTRKVKFPPRKAEDFRKFNQDSDYWHLSYEPEAGLWLEARVSKAQGTVEWTRIDITAE